MDKAERADGAETPFRMEGLRPGDVWHIGGRDLEFVEWYDYQDAGGATLFRKLRFRDPAGGKTFIRCFPAEDGARWTSGRSRHGVGETLYRLPQALAAAAAGGTVWIVEGEKDVRTAERMGLTATCNEGGAGKWRAEFAGALRGCGRAVVIADRDGQGQRHATDVAHSLAAAGVPHTVLTLPDAGGCRVKDLSDWAAAEGGSAEELAAKLEALAAAEGEASREGAEHAEAAGGEPGAGGGAGCVRAGYCVPACESAAGAAMRAGLAPAQPGLERIAPTLATCLRIPAGAFAGSALVWARSCGGTEVLAREWLTDESVLCPAPTLEEVLKSARRLSLRGYRGRQLGGEEACTGLAVLMGEGPREPDGRRSLLMELCEWPELGAPDFTGSARNAAEAALRAWLRDAGAGGAAGGMASREGAEAREPETEGGEG